jgi:formamidopyrimidine-DNA glycosylase
VVAHLGVDLLGPDWDPQLAAANLMACPARAIAEALLDQRVLAGIGNVYCNEMCFIVGRLPTAPAGVSRRKMLWANRYRWNRCTTGDTRSGRQLWVYGRPARAAVAAAHPIRYDDAGERVTYWCPACQR